MSRGRREPKEARPDAVDVTISPKSFFCHFCTEPSTCSRIYRGTKSGKLTLVDVCGEHGKVDFVSVARARRFERLLTDASAWALGTVTDVGRPIAVAAFRRAAHAGLSAEARVARELNRRTGGALSMRDPGVKTLTRILKFGGALARALPHLEAELADIDIDDHSVG